MFKWFSGTKKEIEVTIIIPEPPPANLDVALKIRSNKYNYLYYYHSEDLNEEIGTEFQKRLDRKEEIAQMKLVRRVLHNEIVDEFINRQHLQIEKIHRSIFLRRQISREYMKRCVLKQYRNRHESLMRQLSLEIDKSYKNLLVLRLEKINHQMLMLVLQCEISEFRLPDVDRHVHNLSISLFELKSHVEKLKSFQTDRRLHRLYMRAVRKEIAEVGIIFRSYQTAKDQHRLFMSIVLEELLDGFDLDISYSYSSSEEEYFINNKCVNKHLKILDEDQDFIKWGTIDPFTSQSENEYTFFKKDSIFVEIDFAEFEYLKEENVISTLPENDFKIKESKLEKMAKREGYLKIFLGPMFSGKSSKILFELSCMADQRFRCLYVNNVKDVRTTEAQDACVTTHNSSYSKISPKISCIKVGNLSDVNIDDFDYIAIDELQFFDNENTVQTIIDWITQYGKYVLIASLDGDCYRRRFGKVLDLIPHANEVTKLSSYCDMCRDNYGRLKSAPFTARMTSDTTAELVGGTDLYKAMCRECHDFHLDVTVRKY